MPRDPAMPRQGLELLRLEHGPGRIGRAREHQAVDRRRHGGQLLDREREAGLRPEPEPDDLDAERPQDVLVRRERGLGHDHAVAGIEGGEEAEDEGAGCADRDRHLRGVDLEVVGRTIVRSDRPPQRRPAERFGVAERDPAERPPGRLEDRLRRAAAGLADLEMDHVLARGGACARRGQHVHRDERRDPGAPGDLQPWHRDGGRHTYPCDDGSGRRSVTSARPLLGMTDREARHRMQPFEIVRAPCR